MVVSNCETIGPLPEGLQWVEAPPELDDEYAIYRANLVTEQDLLRHDESKLAAVLIDLYMERTGPLIT